MEPAGFFTVQVHDSGRQYGPQPGARANADRSDETRVAGSNYSVRLGWSEGVLYLTDLGSAGRVLVNGSPIDPDTPVAIQPGDSITIGDTYLAWHPGAETEPEVALSPKVTVELPREVTESQKEGPPAEPESPSDKGQDYLSTEARDATLIVPKQAVEQTTAKTSDPAFIVPQRPAEPPGMPVPTVIEPQRPAKPPEVPDPTLLVPKMVAQPSLSDSPGDKSWESGEGVETFDDTATYKTEWVDMAQILEADTDLEFVSTTILRDTQVPHLVLHTPNRTWAVQLSQDMMTIGRGEDNDIAIPDKSVSQHHALIERRGAGYVIRDTNSRNGTWLRKQRVGEHRLRDGDVLSLGRAKLVFKGGFTSDELTLIGAPRIDGRQARRPVVFVPGLMGTELWLGSDRLWPNPRMIITNPEVFLLPGDPRIEPRGIVNEVVIVPNIIEQRQYSALGDYLVEGLGYTRGKDLLEFGYDWRHDVRLAAQRLAETIEQWQVKMPITIIAHSVGTLVTRYYVERLGGKRYVERIILMGGPHHGTPKGLAVILSGPSLLPLGMGAERMRRILATFPSAYQILPIYPCVTDQNGRTIDVLKDGSWLPEDQRPFLSTARSFRRELGTVSSVPTVSIFGYGLKTKLRVKVNRGADGQWQRVEFVEDMAGDQSVPSGSAVLKGSEIHPVFQEHGSLYVDDDVRMRLKVELTRSTTWQRRC